MESNIKTTNRKRAQSVGTSSPLWLEKPQTPNFGNKDPVNILLIKRRHNHPKVNFRGGLLSKIQQHNSLLNNLQIDISLDQQSIQEGSQDIIVNDNVSAKDNSIIFNLSPNDQIQGNNTAKNFKVTVPIPPVNKPLSSMVSRQQNIQPKLHMKHTLQEDLFEKEIARLQAEANRRDKLNKNRISSALNEYKKIIEEHQEYYETVLKNNRIMYDQKLVQVPKFEYRI